MAFKPSVGGNMQLGSVVYHYNDGCHKHLGLGTVIETEIDEDNSETKYLVSWSKSGEEGWYYNGYLEVLCK